MKVLEVRVTNYRNILDSGWIKLGNMRALIAQNECGKSNLLNALYRFSPYEKGVTYNISEDWPADCWPPGKADEIVCAVKLELPTGVLSELIRDAAKPKTEGAETASLTAPQGPITATVARSYGGQYSIELPEEVDSLLDAQKAATWITGRLPKCVYMDDYTIFNGHAELNLLQQKLQQHGGNRGALSPEEQTIMIILDLAGIDLNDMVTKGNRDDTRTIRGFDTVRASGYLTRQFATLWKQKQIKFDIRVDHTTLDVMVEDVGLGMPIRLTNRSRGFQWYVSFIWRFSHASKGEFKNCILLLDEPGVHLHPAGHRDLLDFFEVLSQSNTVIYTTHQSSMIDTAFPERVRIMEVQDHHARVTSGMYTNQAAPMMVIEQALGLSSSMTGLLGIRQNLIVEGGEDAVIIQKLSGILERAGESGLSERVFLIPANGASKTPMYAGFMVGNKLDAAVLLDSDPAGHAARKKILELFLGDVSKENETKFRVLMLGDAAGIKQNESAIEDLFPPAFFLECVGSAYKIRITEADLPLDGGDQICKRVEAVLQQRGISQSLDKKRVLAEILQRFDVITKVEDLPDGTREKAKKLISSINTAFAKGIASDRPAGSPTLSRGKTPGVEATKGQNLQ